MEKWYNLSEDQALEELGTSKDGLSPEEVQKRQEKYGKNALKEAEKPSLLSRIVAEFTDPMIIVLLLASILSAIVGEASDALIILAIVALNAALSIYQEGKAEEAIEALQKMSAPHARVVRGGKITDVEADSLVPGDIVVLETGDIIPADVRFIQSENLQVDESSLTGESVPVDKQAKTTYDGEIEIGDRANIGHSSTIITYGRARGVVVEIGENTEIGKIASSLANQEDELTPLQRRLNQLSKILAILVIVVCIMVFGIGLLRDMDLLEIFMTAISLAVAAIPEGMPAIVTIVLSLGMTRMAQRNAIVKKLLSVETLGTTTVICSDKTGTLTQNEMTAQKIYVDDTEVDISGTGYGPEGEFSLGGKKLEEGSLKSLNLALHIGALASDAQLSEENGEYNLIGDPTEGALITAAKKAGFDKEDLDEKYPRLGEIPFDSDRKLMTTMVDGYADGLILAMTKGAPDVLIDKSSKIIIDGQVQDFTEDLKEKVLDKNKEFASQALRVLSVAYREYETMPENLDAESVETDMVFVGLIGMIDPARPEAREAIKECKTAGIKPVMITGDHLDTAYAIGENLGIATDKSQAIMGRDLNSMSEEDLRQVVKEKTIFARVSPENKVQIVNAHKQNGEIVAMTGDGVNDAPALKRADIGIAMGITGTDVAKSTAEVILTDDNFATIVHAVEEGRVIYSNIKKFVSFLLSCNVGEVLVVFLALVFNLPVPLSAKQLLWLNLVTDSFPALSLGVEPGEPDIMEQKPRDPNEPILDKRVTRMLIVQSIAITVATLGAYYLGLTHYGDTGNDLAGARTMAFLTLTFAELFRSFSARSDKYNIWEMGVTTNTTLIKGVAVSLILTLSTVFVPFMRDIFDTIPLTPGEWSAVILLSLIPLISAEVLKTATKNME